MDVAQPARCVVSMWRRCSPRRSCAVIRTAWLFRSTPRHTTSALIRPGGAGSGIDEKGNSYIAKFHVESIRLSGARRRASNARAKARNPEQTAVASPSKAQETLSGSGTGFFINKSGYILTAYHVIEDCRVLRRRRGETVEELALIAKDPRNDLAVLKQATNHTAPASFRGAGSARPGESVVVVGFPYYRALSSQAIVTTGTISSVSSLGDDTRFLQITAPVQSGNSGGPLLDQSGNVVGVVLSKLDALKVAELTGDIPQNVNFAIKSSVAETFLQSHGIQYLAKPSSTTIEPADIWEQARDFIVIVECWR